MIRDRTEQLHKLHYEHAPREEPSTNGHKPASASGRSDEEVIEKARSERNGKFERLFGGDTSDYGGDHSSADDAFVHKLRFYTPDPEQIRRIHARSGLHRPGKSGKRHDYLERSIRRAERNVTEFYEWPVSVRVGGKKYGGAESAQEVSDVPPGILLSEVVPERVRWLWDGRIALGKLAVADGRPGLGKSTVTVDFAARVTRGMDWPDGNSCEAGGVVILSAEDGLADTIRPRFDAAGGDPSKVVALSTVPDAEGNERQIAIPDDLHILEAAIKRVDAILVIIDPLMAFLPSDVNSHRDQDIRRALAPASRLAERTGAAVVVVRHLNKAPSGSAIDRGGGSIGIIGAARSGFLIAEHPEDDTKRVMAGVKNNLAPPAPSLVFSLTSTENGAACVSWRGETNLDANALLSAPTDHEEKSALTEAQDFLRDVLQDGPEPASDVRKEADSAGIAKRTLDRARQSIGVVSEREGEAGKRGGGQWMWSIPRIKVATHTGWQPKPSADRTDSDNTAYIREKQDSGLRMPSAEVNKDAKAVGTLNGQPSSGDGRCIHELPPSDCKVCNGTVRKLIRQGMAPDIARASVTGEDVLGI